MINRMKHHQMSGFGFNSTVTDDQMEKVRVFWPDARIKSEALAKQFEKGGIKCEKAW